MKTILRISYWLVSSFFVGWLSTGCNPGANDAAPQGACRIQQYDATSTSRFANTTGQTLYSYDERGNLSKKTTTWRKEPINGAVGSQTSTTGNTYTYDSDGYLISSTEQILTTSVFAGKTTEEKFTTTSSYAYMNGRLTTKIDKSTGPYASQNGTMTTTYDYNATGNLTKMTAGNDSWLYRNNQLVDYTGAGSSYTIQNGVVSKMVTPGSSQEFSSISTFDEQRRLIKHDEYINGQLSRSDVRTWTDAKPASASLPLFKGFPVVVPASPFSGQEGVPATYKQLYWNAISNTMNPFNEDTYTVQSNAQGFITGAVIVSKHPFAADQDYTTTETYTYSGCQ